MYCFSGFRKVKIVKYLIIYGKRGIPKIPCVKHNVFFQTLILQCLILQNTFS